MPEYEIMVCPVCLEQVEPEHEGPTSHYHEDYVGTVEPVTVPASVLAEKFLDAVEAAWAKLEEQWQEEAERREKRAEWKALPEAERERIRAERWAAMSPMEKALYQQFELSEEDLRNQLGRQAFGETAKP